MRSIQPKSIFLGVFIPPPSSSTSNIRQKPLRRRISFTSLESPPQTSKKRNIKLGEDLDFKFTYINKKKEKEKNNKLLLIKASSLIKEALKEEENFLKKENLSSIISKLDYNINNTNLLIEKPTINLPKKEVYSRKPVINPPKIKEVNNSNPTT